MTEPYYQDERVTLYHCDCLKIDAWLEADVLVTDPPYGVRFKQRIGSSTNTRTQRYNYDVIAGDHSPELRDEVLLRWEAGKRPAIVFGSWRVPRPDGTRSLLIWNKEGAFTSTTTSAFYTLHEEIYVIGEGWRKSNNPLRSVITTREIRSMQPGRIGHPTSKPVGLIEKLVDRCPAGVIADPFAGSGSTLVAARNLGRKAIGVEIEEQYCELIARRLDQMALDFEAPA